MEKVTVLGGSSPFTVAFIEALVRANLPPIHLVLQGRTIEALRLVHAYAHHRLVPARWIVEHDTSLERSLEGATLIVHQNRYGGLALRNQVEECCARCGLTADETLGLAALITGITATSDLERMAQFVKTCAPGATVFNLTNPLSITTALLHRFGVRSCFGLCELPPQTVSVYCAMIGISEADVTWDYVGLNHRGFVYDVKQDGMDLLAADLLRGMDGTVDGIHPSIIEELHAIPLKYFNLLHSSPRTEIGRAAFLIKLREQLLAELRHDTTSCCRSIQRRYTAWYPRAVVPCMIGFLTPSTQVQTLTIPKDVSIAVEHKVSISHGSVRVADQSPAPAGVDAWIKRFHAHERNLLQAVLNPSPENVRQTLMLDPMIPETKVDAAFRCVMGYVRRAIGSRRKCLSMGWE